MSIKELEKRRNSWARHVKYRQVAMQNFMNEVINTFKEMEVNNGKEQKRKINEKEKVKEKIKTYRRK